MYKYNLYGQIVISIEQKLCSVRGRLEIEKIK